MMHLYCQYLKIEENLVKFGDLDFLLLVQLVDRYCLDGGLLVVKQEEAEGHVFSI